ncbi:hypothetical protein BJ912DRAFT_926314 [Pholiota molesta]|nr:hypothetical protein BJ912DRAFT_926314 [Pholiota molesta]
MSPALRLRAVLLPISLKSNLASHFEYGRATVSYVHQGRALLPEARSPLRLFRTRSGSAYRQRLFGPILDGPAVVRYALRPVCICVWIGGGDWSARADVGGWMPPRYVLDYKQSG